MILKNVSVNVKLGCSWCSDSIQIQEVFILSFVSSIFRAAKASFRSSTMKSFFKIRRKTCSHCSQHRGKKDDKHLSNQCFQNQPDISSLTWKLILNQDCTSPTNSIIQIIFWIPTSAYNCLVVYPCFHFSIIFRPITLGAYKHETDFEEKRAKMLSTIQTGRAQVQVNKPQPELSWMNPILIDSNCM